MCRDQLWPLVQLHLRSVFLPAFPESIRVFPENLPHPGELGTERIKRALCQRENIDVSFENVLGVCSGYCNLDRVIQATDTSFSQLQMLKL